MQLRKAPITDDLKVGQISIGLITEGDTISVGLLSGEINVNGDRYYTDKDIVNSIREIALKYMDYYNNDIFTKELYESLIEIDCWVDDEKLVITDKNKLEEAYHYLSILTLEEASPDYKVSREPLKIDVVTENTTQSFGILSNVILADDKVYYTDSKRDMVQLITMVAQES